MAAASAPDPAARHRLSIIVPAYDEADGVAPTLRALRESFPDAEILVVDDGSSDATAARAESVPGVRVLRHGYNRGYGAALKTGMRRAHGMLLAWFDADGEHGVSDLGAMVALLEREELEAVLGQRPAGGGPTIRSVGKFLIRQLARSLGVRAGDDLNCGLRVFRRRAILPFLSILPDGFSASLTSTMVLLARRLPMRFHPITQRPRVGSSKVRVADGFASLLLVLRTVALFAPLRIFFTPGLVLLLAGFVYGVATAVVLGRGLPTAALLLANTGTMLCVLGLVADQVSQLRLERLEPHEPREGEPEAPSGEGGRPR